MKSWTSKVRLAKFQNYGGTVMAKGISIHIGLNHVDPQHYQGWDGALNACIADAKDMRALAKKKGFTGNTLLIDGQATAAAVAAALQHAGK
jgi:hypothetical protein